MINQPIARSDSKHHILTMDTSINGHTVNATRGYPLMINIQNLTY